MAYAVIDPNWGEPKPILGTIREDKDLAWAAAISPNADPSLRLYSGASEHPFPSGTPGQVDTLMAYGFRVKSVDVVIVD